MTEKDIIEGVAIMLFNSYHDGDPDITWDTLDTAGKHSWLSDATAIVRTIKSIYIV